MRERVIRALINVQTTPLQGNIIKRFNSFAQSQLLFYFPHLARQLNPQRSYWLVNLPICLRSNRGIVKRGENRKVARFYGAQSPRVERERLKFNLFNFKLIILCGSALFDVIGLGDEMSSAPSVRTL